MSELRSIFYTVSFDIELPQDRIIAGEHEVIAYWVSRGIEDALKLANVTHGSIFVKTLGGE